MKLKTVYCVKLAALLVAGVLGFNPGPSVAGNPTGITPVLPGILLNEDDGGTVREAWVGDHLLISLADPWYEPYGWEVVEITGDALQPIGRSQNMPGPGDWSWDKNQGPPDTAYFRLAAVKTGESTVSLVCNPPPGMGIATIHYEVTINVTR